MWTPQKGDRIRVPQYTPDSESDAIRIQWQQNMATKSARYYVVRVKKEGEENTEALLFVQDRFYRDANNASFIGSIPNTKTEVDGTHWILAIGDNFQYGQRTSAGDQRWLVLHDKNNKMYQHRFIASAAQNQAMGWVKDFASGFGAGNAAQDVMRMGAGAVGDYLKSF